MKKILVTVAIAALCAGGTAMALLSRTSAEPQSHTSPAPGHKAMTAADVTADSYSLVPYMLVRIYAAFDEKEEAAIYDGLAEVAAEEALEELYLERVGALGDGGLEPDQTLHAMEVLRLISTQQGDQVLIDAQWRVVGTVGHDEHLHVRGNTYSAKLQLAPVDDIWRIAAFDLTDIDRSEAGQTRREGSTDEWSAAN